MPSQTEYKIPDGSDEKPPSEVRTTYWRLGLRIALIGFMLLVTVEIVGFLGGDIPQYFYGIAGLLMMAGVILFGVVR